MSYLRVGLKVPDQNKTNRRSLNVQRFAESLSDLKQLGIVLKAKNQFLKKIRDAAPSAPPAESLDELVRAEWSRLEGGAVSLQVAGHDFSELEQLLGDPGNTSPASPRPPAGPPPPPPPPIPNSTSAPPPHFHNVQRSVLPRLGAAPAPARMTRLHWTPLPPALAPGTVWDTLPHPDLDLGDFRQLFQNTAAASARSGAQSPRAAAEARPLSSERAREVEIIMRSFPRDPAVLVRALQLMDDTLIKRGQVDQLLNLLKHEDDIDALKKFNSAGEETLNKAEQFLFLIGTIPRLKEQLIFWRFRQDCEASEKDFCEEFHNLSTAIDIVKSNKDFKLILGGVLKAGNFLNETEVNGFSVMDDLQKIAMMKDKLEGKSLLHHIVSKTLNTKENFGFSDDISKTLDIKQNFGFFGDIFLDKISTCSRTDYNEVNKDLELMKRECSSSLKFLLSQNRGNTEMMNFMRDVMERIQSIIQIETLVMRKYNNFLGWLGLEGRTLKPKDVFKVIHEFCQEVITIVEYIRKETKRKESKVSPPSPSASTGARKLSVATCQDRVDGSPGAPGPGVLSELQQVLSRRRGDAEDRGEEDDQMGGEDEFLRVLTADFKNRRKGVRRK